MALTFVRSPFTSVYYWQRKNEQIDNFLGNRLTGQVLKISDKQYSVWKNFTYLEKLRISSQLSPNLEKKFKKFIHVLRRKNMIVSLKKRQAMGFGYRKVMRRPNLIWFADQNRKITIFTVVPAVKKCRKIRLNIIESKIFKLAQNPLSYRQLNKKLLKSGFTQNQIKKSISNMVQSKWQLIRFVSSASVESKSNLEVFFLRSQRTSRRIIENKKINHTTKNGHVDLRFFHKNQTREANQHFNLVETTVSHAFRARHPALRNSSYGEAFAEAVYNLSDTSNFQSILEVGGGTGIFSKEFLKKWSFLKANQFSDTHYSILDLSPRFLRSQKRELKMFEKQVSFYHDDAQTFSVKRKFDLILCNEVIADFLTVLIPKSSVSNSRSVKSNDPLVDESVRWLRTINGELSNYPDPFYFNLGAIRFMERVYEHLNPGGIAIITEYGSMTSFPVPTRHLNHHEYSIHWPHLIGAAKKIGFIGCTLDDLSTFLNFDNQAKVFSGDLGALKGACEYINLEMSFKNQSEIEIKTIGKLFRKKSGYKLQGIEMSPISNEKYWGPNINQFKAVVLRR